MKYKEKEYYSNIKNPISLTDISKLSKDDLKIIMLQREMSYIKHQNKKMNENKLREINNFKIKTTNEILKLNLHEIIVLIIDLRKKLKKTQGLNEYLNGRIATLKNELEKSKGDENKS